MKGWSATTYLRFLGLALLLVLALLALGYAIDRRLVIGSIEDIAAAILCCGLATVISGLLLAVPGGTPQAALSRFFVAMGIRLLLVAGFAAWCLVGLGAERGPFLFALVASYL
ncbi:MAG: hypothetical protein OES47_06460, partial [Acidobacteriota bacterium]|nr:hypothetical protein [Acidobacteriota bacterium]